MVPHQLLVSVGEVIKAWREERGYKLTALAERAGFLKGYVSEVEKGKIRRPSDEHLMRFAEALDISIYDLINRRLPGTDAAPEALRTTTSRTTVGAGTAVATSPISLRAEDNEGDDAYAKQIKQIIDGYAFPLGERHLAKRLALEAVRAICKAIADDLKDGKSEE